MPAIRGNDYAKGNPGGGAPEGNTNAVGHGAPVGNTNAAKHHGWSDSLKHYHRLDGEALAHTDRLIESSRERYADFHGIAVDDVEWHIVEYRGFESKAAVRDAFRKLWAMSHQWDCAACSVFDDGFAYEEETEYETDDGETYTVTKTKVNPALKAEFRLNSKRRTLEKELGLLTEDGYI